MKEIIEIERNGNGFLVDVTGLQHLEKIINEFENEELPDRHIPFHHEAEIASGFRCFVEWMKRKNQEKL